MVGYNTEALASRYANADPAPSFQMAGMYVLP